ncbi:MAG: FHA domain-containing protein [Acidimicrobiia bacterium]
MTDQLLGVFKICLLILLYLFFARVLWAVWTEVRTPRAPVEDRRQRVAVVDHTAPVGAGPAMGPGAAQRAPRATKGRRGHVGRLVVIEPRVRKGSAFAIGEELTIGRASGCTISIPDDTYISQLHARVFTDAGQVYVEDLGSTNGSMLNGNRLVRPTSIHKGDRLQLGSTVLEAE